MKNPKSIEEQIKALKKNVANQLHDCSMEEKNEPAHGEQTVSAPFSEKPAKGVSAHNRVEPLEDNDSFLAKMYAKRLSMAGVEMLSSVISSYLIAWGIGALFTLSSFWRIILGTLFAFAVNALAVYRMMRE